MSDCHQVKFKYFRDPANFAFRLERPNQCYFCKGVGRWFGETGFYGLIDVSSVCDQCLYEGRLKSLDVTTNEADLAIPDADVIRYSTPTLPKWQDAKWPHQDGQFGVFERFASKADFKNKQEFLATRHKSELPQDLDYLWGWLPKKKIKNMIDGNYDIQVYLFSLGETQFWISDAN